MIFDAIEHHGRYFKHADAWREAFAFLAALTPETAEGETPLMGERMFARVQRYETRAPEQGVLEAHRRYLDIQTVLVGAEAIDWYPQSGLAVKTPYDAANDVEFYRRPADGPPARVELTPGRWALLHPSDAHMPQMIVGAAAQMIKKAVVKIEVGLLE